MAVLEEKEGEKSKKNIWTNDAQEHAKFDYKQEPQRK